VAYLSQNFVADSDLMRGSTSPNGAPKILATLRTATEKTKVKEVKEERN
jgi:hypothetical protein